MSATGKFHNFGEIFQTSLPRRKGAFLDFASEADIQVEDFFTDASLSNMVDQYIDHLDIISAHKRPLIDVKLNSWLVLKRPWAFPGEQPYLMKKLKTSQAAFLMIFRENLADQIISERIARHLNKWHNLTEDMLQGKTISLDLDDVANHARLILMAERFLFSYLRQYRNFHYLTYESLFAADSYPRDLAAFLGDQFKIEMPSKYKSIIKKNEGDKAQIVKNYEAAVARITAVSRNFEPRPFNLSKQQSA